MGRDTSLWKLATRAVFEFQIDLKFVWVYRSSIVKVAILMRLDVSSMTSVTFKGQVKVKILGHWNEPLLSRQGFGVTASLV